METQTISKINLKKIHTVACTDWKKTIEDYASRDLFGDTIELTQNEIDKMFEACTEEQLPIVKKFLKQRKSLIDEINSFEDACEYLGITDSENEINIILSLSTPNKIKLIALYKLEIIIRALNDGWYPNWEDSNESKFFNYFRNIRGFSFFNVDYYNTSMYVPSALYLKNKKLAEHCSKIAIKEYEILYK